MNRAFTLVELAIVLVIIGFLIAGVLQGQELLVQGRISAQISQIKDFERATLTFKSKYNCLPGDCKKATSFFTGVTNGNGSGQLDTNCGVSYDVSAACNFNSSSPELQNFFVELAKANLIKGDYDGSAIISQGLPEMPVRNGISFFAGSSINFITPSATNRVPDTTLLRKGNNAFFFVICQPSGLGSYMPSWDDNCGLFTPQEDQNIDTKIDDGYPLSGNYLGFAGSFPVAPNVCLQGATIC